MTPMWSGIDRPIQVLRGSVKSHDFVWQQRKSEIAPSA
jgi:hypothetical protein